MSGPWQVVPQTFCVTSLPGPSGSWIVARCAGCPCTVMGNIAEANSARVTFKFFIREFILSIQRDRHVKRQSFGDTLDVPVAERSQQSISGVTLTNSARARRTPDHIEVNRADNDRQNDRGC